MSRVFHLLDEQEVFSEFAGGAISRWAANMLRSGKEIILCPAYDDTWQFPPERLHVLPRWSWTGPIHPLLYRLPWSLQRPAYLAVFRPLFELLRPGDLLYVHNRPECAAVLATAAKQHNFRLVLHMHNSHLIRANRGQRAALQDVPLVFVSNFLRSELKAAWPGHRGPTGVVYNGADDCKFRAVTRSQRNIPQIIFTGRLVKYKGAHVLLKAMRLLEKKGVRAECVLVGGSGFGNSRKTAYVRGLEATLPGNTQMLGYRSGAELASLLQNADIFCCPSVWDDPFPLAPLEAMASGLPVVATRSGGIPEALAWGGGVLVEQNDAEDLADALEKLIRDPELRATVGRAARIAFEHHFLWSTVRRQCVSFLEELFHGEADPPNPGNAEAIPEEPLRAAP